MQTFLKSFSEEERTMTKKRRLQVQLSGTTLKEVRQECGEYRMGGMLVEPEFFDDVRVAVIPGPNDGSTMTRSEVVRGFIRSEFEARGIDLGSANGFLVNTWKVTVAEGLPDIDRYVSQSQDDYHVAVQFCHYRFVPKGSRKSKTL